MLPIPILNRKKSPDAAYPLTSFCLAKGIPSDIIGGLIVGQDSIPAASAPWKNQSL
jgi:hypothetical protein